MRGFHRLKIKQKIAVSTFLVIALITAVSWLSVQWILIIDDDPSFLEVCSAILGQYGYRVDTATNSTDGLARMMDQPPDLLILDIMMATMDEGLNFATALKKQEDLAKIPIMIVSARPEVEKGYKRSIEQDMDWISAEIFMEKPIKPDDLLYNVRLLLKE